MTDSTHPGAGNQAKYQSWRLAHERMQTAIAAGFPLEAVAIAESLVTDRLLSFVNFYGAGFNADKTTLHPVAEKAARIARKPPTMRRGRRWPSGRKRGPKIATPSCTPSPKAPRALAPRLQPMPLWCTPRRWRSAGWCWSKTSRPGTASKCAPAGTQAQIRRLGRA